MSDSHKVCGADKLRHPYVRLCIAVNSLWSCSLHDVYLQMLVRSSFIYARSRLIANLVAYDVAMCVCVCSIVPRHVVAWACLHKCSRLQTLTLHFLADMLTSPEGHASLSAWRQVQTVSDQTFRMEYLLIWWSNFPPFSESEGPLPRSQESATAARIRCKFEGLHNISKHDTFSSGNSHFFFVLITPDVISLQFCISKVVGV
jgi:hypothetical protein